MDENKETNGKELSPVDHQRELNHQDPNIPGLGFGGQVMCPLLKAPCLKNACEFWIALSYQDGPVGRCAHAWMPVVAVELRQEMERLRLELRNVPEDEE